MAFALGKDGVAHRNTASYGSPTWDAVTNFANGKIGIAIQTAEARRRASGVFGQVAGVRVDFSASWRMLWDLADTDFTVLMAAMYGLSEIDMTFLSGPTGSGANQGPRFSAVFTKWDKVDDEDDIQACDIEVMAGIQSVPTWFTGTA